MHYTTHQSNVVTLARDAIKSNEEKGGDAYKKKMEPAQNNKALLAIASITSIFCIVKANNR